MSTYGLEFNGIDGYAISASTITFNSDWTLECWFRSSVSQVGCTLIGIADGWNSTGAFLSCANNNGDYVYAQAVVGGAAFAFNTGHVYDGQWHHAAVSYTASNHHCTVFLDGAPGSANTAFQPGTFSSHVTIGAFLGSAMIGNMKEVRVSNNARYTTSFTPSAVLGTDANTIAYWTLNQRSGTTATNGAGSAGVLTLTNAGHGLPVWISDDLRGTGFGDSTYNVEFTPGAGLNSFASWVGGSPSRYLYATTGSNDKALSFDGAATNATTAANLALTSGDFTLECWIKTGGTSDEFGTLISMSDNWGSGGFELNFNQDSDDQLYFISPTSGPFAVFSCDNVGGQIADNNWHHVAVDYDSSTGTAIIFLDGQADNVDTGNDQSVVTNVYSTSRVSIGASWRGGGTTDHFLGAIDEVRISNTRRYAGLDNFTPSKSFTVDSNTLIYWKLNDGSGLTAIDSATVLGTNQHPLSLDPADGETPTWVSGVNAPTTPFYYLGTSLADNGAGQAAYDANHPNNQLPDGAYAADQSAGSTGVLAYYWESSSSSSSSSESSSSSSSKSSASSNSSSSSSSKSSESSSSSKSSASSNSSSSSSSNSSSSSRSSESSSSSSSKSSASSNSSSSSSSRSSESSSSSRSSASSLSSQSSSSSSSRSSQSSSSSSSSSSHVAPNVFQVVDLFGTISRTVDLDGDIARTLDFIWDFYKDDNSSSSESSSSSSESSPSSASSSSSSSSGDLLIAIEFGFDQVNRVYNPTGMFNGKRAYTSQDGLKYIYWGGPTDFMPDDPFEWRLSDGLGIDHDDSFYYSTGDITGPWHTGGEGDDPAGIVSVG